MEKTVLRKTQYLHFREMINGQPASHGGATVCYVPVKDIDGIISHRIGVSIVATTQRYEKSVGRDASFGLSHRAVTCNCLLSMEELIADAQNMVIDREFEVASSHNREPRNFVLTTRHHKNRKTS